MSINSYLLNYILGETMEPQVLQQLIEAIQQLNNRITHLDGDISNMNNRLNTLSNDTRRSTASLESLTNETKKHRSGNKEAQVNDAAHALIDAAKNIVLESTAAAHKTSGDHGIRVHARNRADRIGENYEEALKNRLDMFINAWGRDHRNSQVAYHEEEGIRNILRDLTEDIGNAVGTLRNELENSRSLLNVGGRARDHVIINMDKDYRESINNRGEKEYITISSVFSQAREDVKKLSNDIIQLSNDIKQTQDTVKLTNDVVLDLATNSDAVNKIMLDMNVNMEMANDNLSIFNMLLTSAGNAQWQQATSIQNNIQVMGQMRSMMQQMNATMRRLTNANTVALQNLRNTLNGRGTSNSGSTNTFQQQATRNSDRAKQAGFIALLIPALAKLLKKTPITDYFKLLALRFGAGPSGTGEHPVLGAVGLAAAPILSGALLSSVFRRQIMSIGGKLLGVPAASSLKGISKYGMPPVNPFWIPKNMNGAKTLSWLHPLRSLQNLQHLVADRTVAFQRGWNAPNDIWRRNFNKVNYGYHSLVRDANGNIIRWQNPLTGRNVPVTQARTGQIMNAKMYDWGAHMARVFKPISALGKSPFVAGLLKLGGGVLKKLPLIGAAFDVGSDINQGKHAGKSLLSAGAATGIGLATGGWGFLLYPLIKGGIDGITGNLNKQSKQ